MTKGEIAAALGTSEVQVSEAEERLDALCLVNEDGDPVSGRDFLVAFTQVLIGDELDAILTDEVLCYHC